GRPARGLVCPGGHDALPPADVTARRSLPVVHCGLPATRARRAMSDRPLRNLRVLDFADEKGELCGRLLADLGADVIRVEPPEGARSRRLPPFHAGESLYFAFRNAGKRGITLDLRTAEGMADLHEQLRCTDIWIESFAPGHLESLGIDFTDLAERYPKLIIVRISDFGQTGPYRDWIG